MRRAGVVLAIATGAGVARQSAGPAHGRTAGADSGCPSAPVAAQRTTPAHRAKRQPTGAGGLPLGAPQNTQLGPNGRSTSACLRRSRNGNRLLTGAFRPDR